MISFYYRIEQQEQQAEYANYAALQGVKIKVEWDEDEIRRKAIRQEYEWMKQKHREVIENGKEAEWLDTDGMRQVEI